MVKPSEFDLRDMPDRSDVPAMLAWLESRERAAQRRGALWPWFQTVIWIAAAAILLPVSVARLDFAVLEALKYGTLSQRLDAALTVYIATLGVAVLGALIAALVALPVWYLADRWPFKRRGGRQ